MQNKLKVPVTTAQELITDIRLLAYSRSEAEEYMWHMESTPFTGKTVINSAMSELNDDIAMIVLKRVK